MAIHAFLTLCTVASLFVGGVAFAQQTGTTSGSAAGKNVEPSTATQKKTAAQKKNDSDQQRPEGGAVGGGAPGVEAKPGVEGGAVPRSEK